MKRTDAFLLAALALGIGMALLGLVEMDAGALDDATAARVNDVPIPADELRSLLERRARDGAPVEQLLGTLDDMIDEELLIQRAAELGILRRDSNVRVAIIQAMEKSILNEERARRITEDEARAFYRTNPDLFREPRQLQVEEVRVEDPDLVAAVESRLRDGESAAALAADSEKVALRRVPPVPLSLDALGRRYPAAVVTRLATSAVGDVLSFETQGMHHCLVILSVLEARKPPYEEVRGLVLNEAQLQRQEAAYDEYLVWLRQRADIRRNDRLTP